MKIASVLSCALLSTGAFAAKLHAKARRASVGISVGGVVHHPTTLLSSSTGNDDDIEVVNHGDIAYSTTIKLGGKEYRMSLDTGSSDLWLYSPKETITLTNTTNIAASVTYGKGSVKGKIDFAELEFGDYKVPSQAFLNVDQAVDMDDLFADGDSGLLGLSFDSGSEVDLSFKSAFGSSSTAGRTPLSNIFHQNPTTPNFISVLLGRTGDLDDEVEGLFTIAEYVDEFKAIEKEPKLPRQIVKTQGALIRWNIEVEGVSVNGHSVGLNSSFSGVKANTVIGLLDTGYTFPPVAISIADAIYSSIPGAVKVDGSQLWVVPCMNATSLVFKIGGKAFPIHPLDLTIISKVQGPQGKEYTVCTNAFQGQDNIGDIDMILGDSFLRNVYAVFDWGNESDGGKEGPFVQLLSTTTFDEAIPEFLKVRAESLKNSPPELSPSDLVALDADEKGSKSSASISPEHDGADGTKPQVNLADGESSKFDEMVEKIGGYGPTVIALLAGNLLFLIILTTIGLAVCIRRGGKSKATAPAYVPVKLKDTETHGGQGTSYNTPYNNSGYHD